MLLEGQELAFNTKMSYKIENNLGNLRRPETPNLILFLFMSIFNNRAAALMEIDSILGSIDSELNVDSIL